eukprot:12500913-Alexandrium_andersonii.AAC.1
MRSQRAARAFVRGRHGLRNAYRSATSVSMGRPTSSAAVASLSASGSYRSSVKPSGRGPCVSTSPGMGAN